MSVPTINETNLVSNAEKELRRLCDAIADFNVLRRSHQESAKAKVFEALRFSGFHRINETGNSRKRDELLSIRAKALEYKDANLSSTTDLSTLTVAERNSITHYTDKSLSNVENRIEHIRKKEIEYTRQINELNRLLHINLKEQQYLQDIHKDLKYNINGHFVQICIDEYSSSLNNNPRIIREQNLVIDDIGHNMPQQRVMRLDDSAILGGDLK